jgi:hypothetical protein
MNAHELLKWLEAIPAERANVEVEADTPEAAQQLVEADLENHSVDVEWWRCDCQDDGSVWVVTEIKAEVAAG